MLARNEREEDKASYQQKFEMSETGRSNDAIALYQRQSVRIAYLACT
jgi:hypothetical protein